MPVITIKDPTLLERLKRIKPQPAEDSFDDVLYELLRRAESKPRLSGLEDLPRLVVEEVRKALDGKLAEILQKALLPAVSNITLEIPVELSVKVRVRFEPVFDVAPASNSSSSNVIAKLTNNVDGRATELDELERRAIQLIRENGGCWEGSAYSLARLIAGRVDYALEKRLRRRLIKRDGRICLPEAVSQ